MSIVVRIDKKLGDFHLHVDFKSESRRIGILGASGCGKSMTLKCIAGIETPDEGEITIDGKTVFHSQKKENQKPQKRRIGYLFQNYALFPRMTVEKNIGAGVQGSKAQRHRQVNRMIEKFRLAGLEKRYPGELSGGQQQRVALARIMAYEPDAILLDEPYAALDDFLKDRLQQEMQKMLEDYSGTVIMVSHSRDEIYRFSDELIVMDAGKAVCFGKVDEIFQSPGWKEAARLTGCKNIVPISRVDAHQMRVSDWNTTLMLKREIPEDIRCIGVRAHDFVPVWGEEPENSVSISEGNLARYPFEWKYFLKTKNGEDLCWFVQKNQWEELEERGIPDYLKIPEEKILLLR